MTQKDIYLAKKNQSSSKNKFWEHLWLEIQGMQGECRAIYRTVFYVLPKCSKEYHTLGKIYSSLIQYLCALCFLVHWNHRWISVKFEGEYCGTFYSEVLGKC